MVCTHWHCLSIVLGSPLSLLIVNKSHNRNCCWHISCTHTSSICMDGVMHQLHKQMNYHRCLHDVLSCTNFICDCVSILLVAMIHHDMVWCTSILCATFPSWKSITLSHPPCLYTNYNYFLSPTITLLGVVIMCHFWWSLTLTYTIQQTTHTYLPIFDWYHWYLSSNNPLHFPMCLHRSYRWILPKLHFHILLHYVIAISITEEHWSFIKYFNNWEYELG